MFATMPSFGMDYKVLGKLLTPSSSGIQLGRMAILALGETKKTAQTEQVHPQCKDWLQIMISAEGGFCKTHQ